MPETLYFKDFSSGWCPSDDAVNGRANAQLQMDNLELDTNGALALIGGTSVKQSGFPATAHTLASKYFGAIRHDYSALVNGAVYRDSTSIITGGDGSNAAFATAFNFELICSGNHRVKDSGSGTPVNLGVVAPTVAPTVLSSDSQGSDAPFCFGPSFLANTITTVGTSSIITSANYGSGHARPSSIQYLQATSDASTGQHIVQNTTAGAGPFDFTTFTSWTTPGVTTTAGTALDSDIFPFYGYTPVPFGCSLQIDLLLILPNNFGDQVSNYFSFKINDLSTAQFDPVTGVFKLSILRSDFILFGGGSWANVQGVRITFQGAPGQVINYLGAYPNPGVGVSLAIYGGTTALNGVYQFAQVNVNNTGTYLALSPLGPATNSVVATNTQVEVLVQAPTDPQVNEVWIFARSTGGANSLGFSSQLNAWYRVQRYTVLPVTNVYTLQGDDFTLALDITFNINLVSIASSSISDKIFDIVGPIEGRWLYFTTNFMYPSDINNPDLVNPSLGVRICGSSTELFMWARSISASVILVGTSVDIYLLTGTFATLPDGTIDIYFQPLGAKKNPPISYDAVSYGGAVYYLANDGWRVSTATSFGTTYSGQNNNLLVAPNTDRLYRNETCYGYQPPNLKIQPGSVRFPVCIARNKLWCFITGTSRCEVYDFVRQYWRTFNYGLADVGAVIDTQDGQVLAMYNNDLKLREIGILSSKLIDGATNQTFNVMFTYKDNGKPRQRKDTYTFKSRCYTGSGSMELLITDESQNTTLIPGVLSSPTKTTEQYLDLSQSYTNTLPKSYQVKLSGTVSDLLIEDISIDYDPRPVPLSFLKIQPSNFGNPSKKRIRTWPIVVDTRGQTIFCTPDIDGVPQPLSSHLTNFKQTIYHFFDTDVFGTDYGMSLYDPNALMEVWETPAPIVEQALPVPRQFWQIGPQEFQRLGKVVQVGFRVLAYGTQIPFNIYFSDNSIWNTASFITTPGCEDTYYIDIPKGVNGRILRVELGPCAFNFHPYYMKFRTAASGGQENTELQWMTVPNVGMNL